ncbi:MAG TPA: hypothetical protein PKD91_13015, partial [Bacteroidia bacterium]|nr:hypothetical protein [Bacteroidia bacterium]
MKKLLLQFVFLALLNTLGNSQPCFDWSEKTASATHNAHTEIYLINNTDVVEQTYYNNSFGLPGTSLIKLRRVQNGTVLSPVTLYNSNSSNFTLGRIDMDNGNNMYSGAGQVTFNGTTYNGNNILRLNSGGGISGVIPVSGSMIQIDNSSNLYTVSNNYIKKYSNSGVLNDSVAYSGYFISMDEHQYYDLESGDTIRRYLYPDSLVQMVFVPGYLKTFSYLQGTVRYFLSKNPLQPDSILVHNSAGSILYSAFDDGYNYVIDKDGFLYGNKNLSMKKIGPSGQIWATSVYVMSNSSGSSITNICLSNESDLHFSGYGNYDGSTVQGPNPSLAYYIKPNCYDEIDGTGPL